MSSVEEDQVNEIEAMEAIYLDDFRVISSSVPRQYHVMLVPNTDGQENHVSARLEVEYPPTYPTISPLITVRAVHGLTNDHVATLTTIVRSTLASCVGDVCVFNVCEAVKEWLIDHNKPAQSMFEQMEERRLALERERELAEKIEADRLAAEEAANSERQNKFKGPSPLGIEPGTLVTPESFAMWKALFDAEQARIREERERSKMRTDGRLTGKQLFLQNLAEDVLDDEAERMVEEEVVPKGGAGASAGAAAGTDASGNKVFWLNEGLYADDDVDVNAIREAARADLRGDDDEDDQEEDGYEQQKDGSKGGASPLSSSSSSSAASSSSTTPAAKPAPSVVVAVKPSTATATAAAKPSPSSSSSSKPAANNNSNNSKSSPPSSSSSAAASKSSSKSAGGAASKPTTASSSTVSASANKGKAAKK